MEKCVPYITSCTFFGPYNRSEYGDGSACEDHSVGQDGLVPRFRQHGTGREAEVIEDAAFGRHRHEAYTGKGPEGR